MPDSSNPQAIDLDSPQRLSSLNLDNLSEDQIKSIPRKREYLSRVRVSELRVIARDECGSGTWISHAKRGQLIEGILKGHPPRSVHANDESAVSSNAAVPQSGQSDPDTQPLPEAYSEPIAESLVNLVSKVASRVVSSRLQQIREELDEVRDEVGLDTESKTPREEISELLEEEAARSEEAANRLSDEVEADEMNGKTE
jgi:hypothetical protein